MATYALSLVEEPVIDDPDILPGDADNSGLLTSNDAALVLKKAIEPDFITELDKITSNSLKYMDMDGDGSLSANDAALVLSKVLDPTFEPSAV